MQRQQAFTLIELLIVIAVIGVLAAVLTPSALAARNKGHDGVSISYGKYMLGYATSWLTDQPMNRVSDLQPDCTLPMYVTEGAYAELPGSIVDCEVIQLGADRYGVRVKSVSGKEFTFTN